MNNDYKAKQATGNGYPQAKGRLTQQPSTIATLQLKTSHQYFFVYKPYQVLCQFSAEGDKKTLKDFFDVPKDVYPVGRLDYDSEGALLLTNDTAINQKLLHPTQAHEREYWVQVEGSLTTEATRQLAQGIMLNIDGKPHWAKPCKASALLPAPPVPERNPPIRVRKNITDSWLSLTLTEGKNRQVRRMTAAIGYPTLRLIRYRIGQLTIEGMQPGDTRQLTQQQIPLLFLKRK